MKILLTFIDDNDCHPVLSILHQKEFDKIYLLYNHGRLLKSASEIKQYCQKHFPKLKIATKEASVTDPTDYNTVYLAMYKAVRTILKKNKNAKYSISLTSVSPVIHACWILLCQGHVIDANLIQVPKKSGISEVSFKLDHFPKIRNVDEIKVEIKKLARENEFLKNQLLLKHGNIIGKSPGIMRVKEQIRIFADTNIPIFIQGEIGTGKELIAESIHYSSSRKEEHLVKVSCSAIPPDLFESELFGHNKGAFAGAISPKSGKFKQAHNGTIFLDEIGDLSLQMQAKLLRVLDSGAFMPVGSVMEKKVNVRVISATSKDIKEMVRNGTFREELFYRLVYKEIRVPALRDRENDKILIAQHIVEQLNRKQNKRKVLNKSATDLILQYHWPGNVRQLKNALESAFAFPGNKIIADNIKITGNEHIIKIPDNGIDLNNEILPEYYRAALKKADGNAGKAAKLLGLDPNAFRARLRKLKSKNIDVEN